MYYILNTVYVKKKNCYSENVIMITQAIALHDTTHK